MYLWIAAATFEEIAQGGDRGLIIALCVAVLALSATVVWLAKKIDALTKEYREEINKVQNARVDEMKSIVKAAEALKNAAQTLKGE